MACKDVRLDKDRTAMYTITEGKQQDCMACKEVRAKEEDCSACQKVTSDTN